MRANCARNGGEAEARPGADNATASAERDEKLIGWAIAQTWTPVEDLDRQHPSRRPAIDSSVNFDFAGSAVHACVSYEVGDRVLDPDPIDPHDTIGHRNAERGQVPVGQGLQLVGRRFDQLAQTHIGARDRAGILWRRRKLQEAR